MPYLIGLPQNVVLCKIIIITITLLPNKVKKYAPNI
jgi:hypothetical protein